METRVDLCAHFVSTTDDSSSEMTSLIQKQEVFFFSAMAQCCQPCENIFMCSLGFRWRRWADAAFSVEGSGFSICWVRGLRRLWSCPATFKHELVPFYMNCEHGWDTVSAATGLGPFDTGRFIKWPSHSKAKDQRRDNTDEVFKDSSSFQEANIF